MRARTKSLIVMHVPDDSGRRVRLASFDYQRRGRSKYLTLRGVIEAIPDAAFELTSTYDSTREGVTIVVQQRDIMACNVAVALRPFTYVGVRLPSGHFVEIYYDWPDIT